MLVFVPSDTSPTVADRVNGVMRDMCGTYAGWKDGGRYDGKQRTSRDLDNPVLRTGGRGTLIDAYLATAVLLGLVMSAALGWWCTDPVAGPVIVYYAGREGRHALAHSFAWT